MNKKRKHAVLLKSSGTKLLLPMSNCLISRIVLFTCTS